MAPAVRRLYPADSCRRGQCIVAGADQLLSTGGLQVMPSSPADTSTSQLRTTPGDIGVVVTCKTCAP